MNKQEKQKQFHLEKVLNNHILLSDNNL